MLDKLKASPRWQELFKHCANPSCCAMAECCDGRTAARLQSVPLDPVKLADVVEILRVYDGAQTDNEFLGIFQLADGRCVSIRGWFYDLGSGNLAFVDGESFVAKNIPDIIKYGITLEERTRLSEGRMAF